MAKMQRRKIKLIVIMCLTAALAVGFLSGAAAPGSESDPLVTQSWVDNYVAQECGKLQARIDALSAAVGGGNRLCLWIGLNTVTKNGVQATIDVAPMLLNNRTFLPFRYIGETVGAEIKWDNNAKKVTYVQGGKTIELWIGKNTVKVNGTSKSIDAAPVLSGGRTLAPIRFVMENLGARLQWDNEEKKVTVIY